MHARRRYKSRCQRHYYNYHLIRFICERGWSLLIIAGRRLLIRALSRLRSLSVCRLRYLIERSSLVSVLMSETVRTKSEWVMMSANDVIISSNRKNADDEMNKIKENKNLIILFICARVFDEGLNINLTSLIYFRSDVRNRGVAKVSARCMCVCVWECCEGKLKKKKSGALMALCGHFPPIHLTAGNLRTSDNAPNT